MKTVPQMVLELVRQLDGGDDEALGAAQELTKFIDKIARQHFWKRVLANKEARRRIHWPTVCLAGQVRIASWYRENEWQPFVDWPGLGILEAHRKRNEPRLVRKDSEETWTPAERFARSKRAYVRWLLAEGLREAELLLIPDRDVQDHEIPFDFEEAIGEDESGEPRRRYPWIAAPGEGQGWCWQAVGTSAGSGGRDPAVVVAEISEAVELTATQEMILAAMAEMSGEQVRVSIGNVARRLRMARSTVQTALEKLREKPEFKAWKMKHLSGTPYISPLIY